MLLVLLDFDCVFLELFVYVCVHCSGFFQWIHVHRDIAVQCTFVGRRHREIIWLQSGTIPDYVANSVEAYIYEARQINRG